MTEPLRETITHRHPSLPFIEITQTRHVNADPAISHPYYAERKQPLRAALE